jgi:hypothetical protein
MKNVLFLFAMLFAIGLSGQTNSAKGIIYTINADTDTLGTSTTLAYEFQEKGRAVDFPTAGWEYSFIVQADSISGANAGTVALQVSNSLGASTPVWVTIDTDTIDGATAQVFTYDGVMRYRRIRVLVTSPSGTRRTDISIDAVAKR